jgi:hypothetical protein
MRASMASTPAPVSIDEGIEAARPRAATMNKSESAAWRMLIALGASPMRLFGKQAIDLRTCRRLSGRRLRRYTQAVVEVVGRSGANRRHVARDGAPMFVVTDQVETE